jgi:quercetin dioxygenase-like cupin family protein
MAPAKPALGRGGATRAEDRSVRHVMPVRTVPARIALGVALVFILLAPAAGPGAGAEQRVLVDNERVMVVEFVFPAGFRGEEHEAPVDEFAYVIDGEFAVVTKGKGTRVVRRGEVEWAPRGVVHYSVNETTKPARVLVVLLKGR